MTSEHDDFWGGSADWPTAQNPLHSDAAEASGRTPRSRITGRHRLSGFLGRGTAPTREHRVAERASTPGEHESDYAYGDDGETFDWDFADDPAPETRATPVDGTPRAADDDTPEWGEEWAVAEPRSRAAMIDPLLARIGAVVVAVTLAVPLILALRPDSDLGAAVNEAEAAAPTSVAAGPASTPPPSSTPGPETSRPEPGTTESAASTSAGGTAPASSEQATTAPATSPATSEAAAADSATAGSAQDSADDGQVVSALSEAESATTAAAAAQPVAPACALEYEVVAGDFWLRLAEGAGVSLDDLLAVNGADSGTALYPGSTICLPAGASTPPPPPATTAAPTTAAPTTAAPTTAAPTTAAPTTAAPTTAAPTTAAPTTAAPTTAAPAATGSVEAIIRAVWPDELEEKALQIAWRESNHRPDVRNYCCIGLFQIYWEVHQGWLADMGITTLEHLYDPAANARAAYALYQRAGGWGPWGG